MSFEESMLPNPESKSEAEPRTRGGQLLALLVAVDLGLAVALSLAPIVLGPWQPAQAAEPAAGLTIGADEAMNRIAPALPQIINLALLDPQLASTMVPDEWIDGGIESARLVAHEEPRPRPGAAAAAAWPVGPFATARDLEQSIRSLDPAAAAALYGALGPRIAARCRVKGASFARCEQEIRMSLERLAAPVVAARVAGRDDAPITDTQLEFARLGQTIVAVGTAKIEAVRRAVWPAGR
ncbi:MAG: hypothetical protein R3F21_09485 [Myxococcota bacterium]